jgi:hypothetical protein
MQTLSSEQIMSAQFRQTNTAGPLALLHRLKTAIRGDLKSRFEAKEFGSEPGSFGFWE